MAQVGIHADPAITSKWQGRSIPDDPIGVMSNKRGTFSFATSGDNISTAIFHCQWSGANHSLPTTRRPQHPSQPDLLQLCQQCLPGQRGLHPRRRSRAGGHRRCTRCISCVSIQTCNMFLKFDFFSDRISLVSGNAVHRCAVRGLWRGRSRRWKRWQRAEPRPH